MWKNNWEILFIVTKWQQVLLPNTTGFLKSIKSLNFGGQMGLVLPFWPNDPSLIPAEVNNFNCWKIAWTGGEIK